MDRRPNAVLRRIFAARATPSMPQLWAQSPRPGNVPGSCVEAGVELPHRHASRDGAERRRERSRLPAGTEDHVGRRRAVQVARRVEAPAGWCVYSSPTAVTAKPASWREARTSASVWKYCRCCSLNGSPSRGRVSSILVSQVRAPGSTMLLITKSFPADVPATLGLEMVKLIIASVW